MYPRSDIPDELGEKWSGRTRRNWRSECANVTPCLARPGGWTKPIDRPQDTTTAAAGGFDSTDIDVREDLDEDDEDSAGGGGSGSGGDDGCKDP